LWRCAAFFATLLQCHYQQSQRPTDASHRFIFFRQWRSMAGGKTILGAKSKLLYNEIALSRKPFGIGHMYVYNFLLRLTDTMTSQNNDLVSRTFSISALWM
jgi:hypothetical protein